MSHQRWESLHRRLGPVSLDDLAARWAYRKGIHLPLLRVQGAQRALEIHLAALEGSARRLGHRWARARQAFCERSGLPDPRAGMRVSTAVWWVRWLAKRGWANGDHLTSVQHEGLLEDLMAMPEILVGRLTGACAGGDQLHTLHFARAASRAYVLVITPTSTGVMLELRAYRSMRRHVRPTGSVSERASLDGRSLPPTEPAPAR